MPDEHSSAMPDAFDRQMGRLEGLPDLVRTNAATIRVTTPLLGHVQTWIVQTFRQRDEGDTIFVELADKSGHVRLVLPARVSELVARQRDALTKRNRRKAARGRAGAGHRFTAADRAKAAKARKRRRS